MIRIADKIEAGRNRMRSNSTGVTYSPIYLITANTPLAINVTKRRIIHGADFDMQASLLSTRAFVTHTNA